MAFVGSLICLEGEEKEEEEEEGRCIATKSYTLLP